MRQYRDLLPHVRGPKYQDSVARKGRRAHCSGFPPDRILKYISKVHENEELMPNPTEKLLKIKTGMTLGMNALIWLHDSFSALGALRGPSVGQT